MIQFNSIQSLNLLKAKYLCVYALTVLTNVRVVDATLFITAKLAAILNLELVSSQACHVKQTNDPNQKNQ